MHLLMKSDEDQYKSNVNCVLFYQQDDKFCEEVLNYKKTRVGFVLFGTLKQTTVCCFSCEAIGYK